GAQIVGSIPPPLRLGYTLDVQGDELVFRSGSSVLRGQQIVGGTILVKLPGQLPLPVVIAGHQAVPSWAEGEPPIAAYTLLYTEPGDLLGSNSVCSGDALDGLVTGVTVLGGERYDESLKTVLPGQP